MAESGVRVAMWSGPRNISTAMMRSWEARGDTAVIDEPLYAHYLKQTGLAHPGAAAVMAHHETDASRVIDMLIGPIPGGAGVFYQKHMAHHLLPGVGLDWIGSVRNCFLIREPREMITSLAKIISSPTPEQTGLPQQVRLFDMIVEQTGRRPPVIDGRDVLDDPPRMLALLCEAIGVAYTDRMLSWRLGQRRTDGVWAKHWYGSVEQSTGFEPYTPKNEPVPDDLAGVLALCDDLYARLACHRLR